MLNCKACNPTHLISNIKNQTLQWKKQCSKLTRQYQNLQTQYENAQRKIQVAYDQLLSLKCNCNFPSKDTLDIKSKARTIFRDNKQMEVILQHQKTILKKLENKLECLELQSGSDASVPADHIQCQANIQNLQADIESLNICVQEHQLIRELNTQEMTNLEIQLNELAKENAQVFKDLSQCQEIIHNLEQQNQELTMGMRPLGERSQIDDLQYRCKELESLSEVDQASIKELELKLKRAVKIQERLKCYEKELKVSQRILEECRCSISDKNSEEYEGMTRLLLLLKSPLKIGYLEQNEQIMIKQEIISYQIEEATKELLEEQKSELRGEMEKLKQKMSETEQKYFASQMKEKDLVSQKEKLQLKMEQIKDSRYSLQSKVSDKMSVLKQRNEQMQLERDEAVQKQKELQIENCSLKDVLERQEKQIQKIQLQFYEENV